MKKVVELRSPCCGARIEQLSGLDRCTRCERQLGMWPIEASGGIVMARSDNPSTMGGFTPSGHRRGARNTGGLGGL